MKNKIRRAFDLTKPNVLGRVLEACPDSENAPAAKPKRKHLSDRAMQFIATAASIAILISAAGGGFLYYRDYFAGQSTHGGNSGSNSGQPITLPYPNLDWDTPEPNETEGPPIATIDLISEEKAKEIALEAGIAQFCDAFVFDCQLIDEAYYRVGVGYSLGLSSSSITPGTQLGVCYYYVDAYSAGFLEILTDVLPCTEEGARMVASAYAEIGYDSYTIKDCVYYFRSGLPSFYSVTISVETPDGQKDICVEINEFFALITPPSGRTLTMAGARDIALGMWGHYIDYIHCLKIAENSDFYTVYYEQGEYAYEFHIDFDGNVLYDSGAQQIGLRADQQMGHLIGWEKARSIALNACGRDVSELIGFTYEYYPSDPDYYHLELYFPDKGFTYRIGALNGELLEGNVSPMHLDFHVSDGPVYTPIDDLIHNYDHNIRLVVITSADELAQLHEDSGYEVPTQYDEDFFKESALLIVDYYYGSSPYQIRITDILMDAEGNYTVSVAYCAWELGDCMVVTGSLLAEVYQPIDPTAQVDLNITQLEEDKWNDLISSDTIIDIDKATQIALEYTGHMEDYLSGNVEDMACKFDEAGNPASYYIYFRVGTESYEVGILAATGEVLFCNGWAVDEPILSDTFTKEDATQVALSCLAGADTYPVVECHQIGTETNRIIYLVICKKPGMSVTTMVDGNTLRIMDSGMSSFPETALTEQEVRTIAYKACGLEEEGPMCTAMLGMFNDGVQFYCAKVYWDEMVYVVVMDANTGEVLAQSKFENTRIPGHILTEDQALEYALANAFVSPADAQDVTCVFNEAENTYTVSFRYQTDLCVTVVKATNGSIVDMYWVVDE